MDETTREIILAAVSSFPAMSSTATKVLKLLNEPSTNVGNIETAVKYDPGLTANVLRLANSAYFGFPGTIHSVSQAITQLGWKRMSQLVLASTVHALLENPIPGYNLAKGELWRRAIAGAVAAEIVVKKTRLSEADEAFTAALLREIGKLIIGDYVESYAEQIQAAIAGGMSITDAEREILGTDHAEVGAWILEHWSLPSSLCQAVKEHAAPDFAKKPSPLTDAVHIANALAHAICSGKTTFSVSKSPLSRLNLTTADLPTLADQTSAALAELGDTFS